MARSQSPIVVQPPQIPRIPSSGEIFGNTAQQALQTFFQLFTQQQQLQLQREKFELEQEQAKAAEKQKQAEMEGQAATTQQQATQDPALAQILQTLQQGPTSRSPMAQPAQMGGSLPQQAVAQAGVPGGPPPQAMRSPMATPAAPGAGAQSMLGADPAAIAAAGRTRQAQRESESLIGQREAAAEASKAAAADTRLAMKHRELLFPDQQAAAGLQNQLTRAQIAGEAASTQLKHAQVRSISRNLVNSDMQSFVNMRDVLGGATAANLLWGSHSVPSRDVRAQEAEEWVLGTSEAAASPEDLDAAYEARFRTSIAEATGMDLEILSQIDGQVEARMAADVPREEAIRQVWELAKEAAQNTAGIIEEQQAPAIAAYLMRVYEADASLFEKDKGWLRQQLKKLMEAAGAQGPTGSPGGRR